MRNKGILHTEVFYVDHLNANYDLADIESFHIEAPEGQGLSVYLKEYAISEEKSKQMRTYLVRDIETDELVGYFSLKAGMVSVNETEFEIKDNKTGKTHFKYEFDTLPGIELANFAVNSNYIKKYPYQKGVGHIVFSEFIIPIINKTAENIGVTMVYIFALPYERLIERYKTYGFQRLPESEENDLHRRLKPRYDESCKFMYLLLN